MRKLKPLKIRCANNNCTRNAVPGMNLCRKHEEMALLASIRKFRERKELEVFRKSKAEV